MQGKAKPFVVSEYLERMEKAGLDILEAKEPKGQTIILWWGLDGIKLNEDGSVEQVNRRRSPVANSKPATPMPQFHMCGMQQSAADTFCGTLCLRSERWQMEMNAQNMAMIAALQSYAQPYPCYIQAGVGGQGCMRSLENYIGCFLYYDGGSKWI